MTQEYSLQVYNLNAVFCWLHNSICF